MSKKNNKKQIKQKPAPTATQSSMSYSFNRWFRKILTTHPSEIFIAVIIIGYALVILGGTIFNMTNDVMTAAYFNNRYYFLYPSLSDQFVADTVISIMLYIMGFVGLLSIYQSTKNVNKPRQAYMLLIAGASLVLLSYICLESAVSIKVAGIR